MFICDIWDAQSLLSQKNQFLICNVSGKQLLNEIRFKSFMLQSEWVQIKTFEMSDIERPNPCGKQKK